MTDLQQMSSSSPDKKRQPGRAKRGPVTGSAPSSHLEFRRSISFRNVHSLMDAWIKPAHDGARQS
jgi:hypothetical protein